MTMPSLSAPTDSRLRSVLWLVAGLGAGVLLIGAIVVVTQIFTISSAIRETQVYNSQRAQDTKVAAEAAETAAKDAARSADRIEECTTPGRKCFEDAGKRTEEAIVGINRGTLTVIVAAISCQVDGITDQEALARCTVKRSKTAEPRKADPNG